MADIDWLGSNTPGDLSVGANYSGGVLPSSGDALAFGPTSNQTDITLAMSALDGINLALLHRHPLFTGAFGTSGDPMQVVTTASGGQVIVQGVGAAFIKVGTGGSTVIANLYVDTDNQVDTVELDGDILNLFLIKGRIKLLSTATPTKIHVNYRQNPTSDVHFTYESTNNVALINIGGGTVIRTGSGVFTALNLSRGTLDSGPTAGAITTGAQTGGNCVYRGTGTIGTWNLLAGILDLSRDPRAKTINFLHVFRDATFIPNANTTISNDPPNPSVHPIIPVKP